MTRRLRLCVSGHVYDQPGEGQQETNPSQGSKRARQRPEPRRPGAAQPAIETSVRPTGASNRTLRVSADACEREPAQDADLLSAAVRPCETEFRAEVPQHASESLQVRVHPGRSLTDEERSSSRVSMRTESVTAANQQLPFSASSFLRKRRKEALSSLFSRPSLRLYVTGGSKCRDADGSKSELEP